MQEIVAGSNLDNRAVEGRHILVIEDDEDVRSMLVECLQAFGYTVSQARDGVSGLERLHIDDPDLLMVDYAMPGMNGLQVIEKAREFRESLPVILATGYADVDISTLADKRLTALRKPFQLDELSRVVRLALSAPT
jgi:CheY-like chemotaxis protein